MNKHYRPHHKVIIISGPTATGKSDFAYKLGAYFDNRIEIINGDIGSFYKQLTIGTAKPDISDSNIRHHFFDIIDLPDHWTVHQFRQELAIVIGHIIERGNIPILVGGSSFYIQSFFYKQHELQAPKAQLIQTLESQTSYSLWNQLNSVDPDRAAAIDQNDQYRLVRALTIWHTEHKKPSEFEKIFDPIAPFYYITLLRDRNELYSMINQRVDAMIQAGWVDEVKCLMSDESWRNFLFTKKIIGYDTLIEYLEGKYGDETLDTIISVIAQRTRNYAKRQITFLKKLSETVAKDQKKHQNKAIQISPIEECNLTLCDLSLYIKQLSERISNFLHSI